MMINRKERRWMAVSCSHGHLINKSAAEEVLKFRDEYKPHTTIHLGDYTDLSALMGKAVRSGEGGDIMEDLSYGIEFLRNLRPTTVFHGNHEERIFRLLDESNSELVRFAAGECLNKINSLIKQLKADTVPYLGMSNPDSYRNLGGTLFTHGYAFGMMAARDHVESTGRPIVMGHIHKIAQQPGRLPGAPTGYAIGCLCDIPSMAYARNRRETASWDHAYAFGSWSDNYCTVNIQRIKQWQPAKYKQMK